MERHMNLAFKAQFTKIEDGKELVVNITFGDTEVSLPNYPNECHGRWYL